MKVSLDRSDKHASRRTEWVTAVAAGLGIVVFVLGVQLWPGPEAPVALDRTPAAVAAPGGAPVGIEQTLRSRPVAVDPNDQSGAGYFDLLVTTIWASES